MSATSNFNPATYIEIHPLSFRDLWRGKLGNHGSGDDDDDDNNKKDRKRKGEISAHRRSDIAHVDLGKNEMANGVNILGLGALLFCKAMATWGKRS